jgi:hypothetical protein
VLTIALLLVPSISGSEQNIPKERILNTRVTKWKMVAKTAFLYAASLIKNQEKARRFTVKKSLTIPAGGGKNKSLACTTFLL